MNLFPFRKQYARRFIFISIAKMCLTGSNVIYITWQRRCPLKWLAWDAELKVDKMEGL